jgi:membrane protease YdiL (CAAX protease family)
MPTSTYHCGPPIVRVVSSVINCWTSFHRIGKNMSVQSRLFPFFVMIIVPLGNILFLTIFANPLLGFLWYHIFSCLLLPFIYYCIFKKLRFFKIFQKLGFNNTSVSSILLSVSLGIISAILMIIFSSLFYNTLNTIITVFPKSQLILISGIYTIVANPLLEEIFWRGFLFELSSAFKKKWTIGILNSICFTSFHVALLISFSLSLIIIIILTISVFLMGIAFYYFKIKYNSILTPIILHYCLAIGYTSIFLFFVYK